MDVHGFLTQQCLGIAALISESLKGGDAPGSKNSSPLFVVCSSSSPAIWILSGALTLNAQQFRSVRIGEGEILLRFKLVAQTEEDPILGFGYILGSGLRPHSDRTQLAIFGRRREIKREILG